jgi:hypothetical protein
MGGYVPLPYGPGTKDAPGSLVANSYNSPGKGGRHLFEER